MEPKVNFTKTDFVFALGCVVFLLVTIGAVGDGGRGRAKEAVCFSNLRQWGTAASMYCGDHDGYFPNGWMGMSGQRTSPTAYDGEFFFAYGPYYNWDKKLLLCPVAVRYTGSLPEHLRAWSQNDLANNQGATEKYKKYHLETGKTIIGSYAVNGWVYNPLPNSPSGGRLPYSWRTMNVAGGDNIPMMGDGYASTGHGYPVTRDEIPQIVNDPTHAGWMCVYCIPRHNCFVNFVFLDLSVRKIGLKQLWTLKWSRNYDVNDLPGPDEWPDWFKTFGCKDYY